jgi:hypothetical protein
LRLQEHSRSVGKQNLDLDVVALAGDSAESEGRMGNEVPNLMAACIALYAEALLRGSVARVILLFYLTPVWSTLLAWVFLGARITGVRIVTVALGLAGEGSCLAVTAGCRR